MKVQVVITHYNRPDSLKSLVAQCLDKMPGCNISIYDDGSELNWMFKDIQLEKVTVHPLHHHGKTQYYKIWNRIFADLQPGFDAYLFLPDDVELTDDFDIEKAAEMLYIRLGTQLRGDAVSLMPDNRSLAPQWNCGLPMPAGNAVEIGSWDCCGLLTWEMIAMLKRRPLEIPQSRWRNNPQLGSGVGMEISTRIQFSSTVRVPMVKHLGIDSKMNPKDRTDNPLKTIDIPPIIVGMATIPGRERQCVMAINSLLPYVDEVHLCINGFGKTEGLNLATAIGPYRKVKIKATDNSLGDGFKFSYLKKAAKRGAYFLSCDDDLIYPPDYVSKMLQRIEHYGRKDVLCVHGKTLPQNVPSFYRGHRVMHHTTSAVKKDQVVNCAGTGCTAFHTSAIDFGIDDIEQPNMADIWFAKAAARQGVRLISINRPANWLKIQELEPGTTIYEQENKADQRQTEAWNGIWEGVAE
jgi:hypothetical protein